VKPTRSILLRGLSLLPLLLLGVFLSGCATTESENESVRPWNAPKSWENGLPAGMMEGR
jgi:hypothetical protein